MGKHRVIVIIVLSFFALNFSISNDTETPRYLRGEYAVVQITRPLENVIWHWENEFSPDEIQQIKSWLATVNKAVFQTLGTYPFKLHYYIHRSNRGDEPVPWANTTRGNKQGVHFHINLDFSLEEFLADWTAQHEISHLSIPFVGSKNAWFSEGYATFMQNQVMLTQGVFTKAEVENKYLKRVAKCKSSYQTKLSFPAAADSLKRAWNYPDMYWGGVSFFWKLDKEYQKEYGQTLTKVIKTYTKSGRVNDSTPREVCADLDRITQTKIASNLLIQYETEPAYLIFEEM